MEEILVEFSDILTKNIVDAINNHATPRPYDYWLLVFTALSIILSFVAILCTISISRKQSKIALFNEKTVIMNEVEQIHSFYLDMFFLKDLLEGEIIKNDDIILSCDKSLKYDESLKTFKIQGGEEQYPMLYKHIKSLKITSYKAEILYKNITCKELFEKYIDVLLDVYDREENIKKKVDEFVNIGNTFFNKDFEKLKKQLQI